MSYVIDVHHHILPDFFWRETNEGANPVGGIAPPPWDQAGALSFMDDAGIDVAVTSISAPGVHVGDWAHNRGLIAKNPCAKGGKLYHGTRVNKIWDDEDVARFLKAAPHYLHLAMLLAIYTGQRQGDLLRLPWSAYNGAEIKLRQRKTGQFVPIPVADALKAALDAAPRQSPIMLTNSEGKPWSESGFQGAWGKATMRAGIRGLTFHDLRGTAVVTLARAGCNEVEIYSITGHKPGDVRAILTAHYLPRDAEVAGKAIAKLNRYKMQRGDQKGDENLPTALPTGLKIAKVKREKS
jgi:integrase